ncbi:receptor-like protein 7 [Triticum dicoccoides]|uniref:receptor-like protein 7 n=1 Tax=Triticum dicoccoides TaxID=85692 RepID=UPI000E78E5FE|nr:receptor-like protein 7 [Triticum dicoccoides]
MAMVRRMLLLFLAVLPALATSGAHGDGNLTVLCHSDEAATLLQLKKSFLFSKATTSLPSWQDGTNCCRWEGVGCGGSTGRVTNLNLNGRGLISPGLDPVIFNLASLRFLDLSRNDFSGKSTISGFSGYSMPTVGLERLTFLSHLNLSKSGFEGEIPIAIGKLENLVSLDLSIDVEDDFLLINSSWISDFQGLVGNLRNLRELYLDGVDMSGSGEGWCYTLVKSTPCLQVLSLGECYLYGPIHQSLLNLSSLTVINLQSNSDIFAGRFPEFFMDFVNLTVLQVYDNNLEGWFPPRSFQSKRLRFLDLSGNTALSGSLPNFYDARSLHSLILYETNFSFSKPSSFSNFLSLQELALDAKYISAEFRSSLNMLPSLSVLLLSGFGFQES